MQLHNYMLFRSYLCYIENQKNTDVYALQYQELTDMGVSKNSGTPKWMVCNGKPY